MRTTLIQRGRAFIPVAFLLLVAALPALYSACTPGNSITAAESDVVVTQYDNEFDFNSVTTYLPPDTIYHVTSEGIVDNSEKLDRSRDAETLARITSKLNDRGFVPVTSADPNPGYTVITVATAVSNYSAYTWYPWWGGWWGGGCCYYPPVYPPTVGYTYNFTTGTLVVQMLNTKDRDPLSEAIPVPWTAGMNGVLDDANASVNNRLNNAIDQAFEQSPYLTTGN
jgi:hypothetical protein